MDGDLRGDEFHHIRAADVDSGAAGGVFWHGGKRH
jgi:hypothetical protein